MEFTYQPGQTPLDPDEKEGLKPKHISTQGELNEWEQLNIIKGARWAQRQLKQDVLDDDVPAQAAQADVQRYMDMGWNVPQERQEYRLRLAPGFYARPELAGEHQVSDRTQCHAPG